MINFFFKMKNTCIKWNLNINSKLLKKFWKVFNALRYKSWTKRALYRKLCVEFLFIFLTGIPWIKTKIVCNLKKRRKEEKEFWTLKRMRSYYKIKKIKKEKTRIPESFLFILLNWKFSNWNYKTFSFVIYMKRGRRRKKITFFFEDENFIPPLTLYTKRI